MSNSYLAVANDDLNDLKQKAYADIAEADRHAGLAVVYAARAGARFWAMKQLVERTAGYGSWGTWVDANVEKLSARSVQFYMQLARTLPALADPDADVERIMREQPMARELAGLSLRKAMQRLAEPKRLPGPTEFAHDEAAVDDAHPRELTQAEHDHLAAEVRQLSGRAIPEDVQQQIVDAFERQQLTSDRNGFFVGYTAAMRDYKLLPRSGRNKR